MAEIEIVLTLYDIILAYKINFLKPRVLLNINTHQLGWLKN